MKETIAFLKKNRVTQFFLSIFRSLYFLPYLYYSKKWKLNILSPLSTVKNINAKKLSVARFGDGEFNIIFRKKGIGFQPYSQELSCDLLNVLVKEKTGLKVGIPHGYRSVSHDKFRVKAFWWSYVVKHHKDILNFVSKSNSQEYLDTNFTRTITELRDKKYINSVMTSIKNIWREKQVLIVEGSGTRFGSENSLLSNAKSVSRIIAPAVNAYGKIDEIRVAMRDFLTQQKNLDDVVVLIALGPTATVLAGEFDGMVQTVDIGHLDLQYEYLQKGFYKKVKIETRYDNEMVNGFVYVTNNDKKYDSEIIDIIS